MKIREATDEDRDALWEIFSEVIKKGDTYVFPETTTKDEFDEWWLAPHIKTYVLENGHEILGTYIIKPNQPGRGCHVANCSYMVKSSAQGNGIGSQLCIHSIQTAKKMGFLSIQFNLVVSTNKRALQLWEKHGFKIIGEIPDSFDHKQLGLTSAFILWREV